jgi:hypothetical protein
MQSRQGPVGSGNVYLLFDCQAREGKREKYGTSMHAMRRDPLRRDG